MSVLAAQAEKLAEDGLDPMQIEAELIRQGHSADVAKQTVTQLRSWVANNQARQSEALAAEHARSGGSGTAALNIGLGLAMIGGGLVLSVVGPRIFIGLIVVGVMRLVRGFASA